MSKGRGFLCFFILLTCKSFAGVPAQTLPPAAHWRMEIGSTRELQAPPGSLLRLNQKRLIEVEDLGGQHFRILALHSGTVYMKAVDSGGQLLASWMVEVLAAPSRSVRDTLDQRSWEHYFCAEKDVTCDKERFLIAGESSSLPWLQEARARCEKNAPCRFEVRLGTAARSSWEADLRRETGRDDLSVDREGYVQIAVDCKASERRPDDDILKKLLEERYGLKLLLRCHKNARRTFRLELIALAHRSQASDHDNPLRWEGLTLPSTTPLRAILQHLSEKGEAHIIAQPQIPLLLGAPVLVSDGLEIETVTLHAEQASSSWKSVGFQLSCELMEEKAATARLKVDMRLSRPRGERQTLDSSQLQTQLWMGLSRWQLLGRIQSHSDGAEEGAWPWLSRVPLLGFFFRWTSQQRAASDISLFARLEPEPSLDTDPPSLEKERSNPEESESLSSLSSQERS